MSGIDVASPAATALESMINEVQKALTEVKDDGAALSATIEDMMPYLIASLPEDIAIRAGYNISEVLISCTFNGVRCWPSDFKLQRDPNYGNCYTFNADGTHMTANMVGEPAGLSVAYFLGEAEYLSYVQPSGVRMVVSQQDEPILPDSYGVNTASGFQAGVSLKKISSKHLDLAKVPCAHSKIDVSVYNFSGSYSSEACWRSCYQHHVIQRCQCGDPRVPLPTNSTVGYCNILRRDCVNDNYGVTNKSADAQCDCPLACEVELYETSISTRAWPSSQDTYIRTLTNASNVSSSNQLVGINVYYEDLSFIEYSEWLSYSMVDLLSDFAAVAGLLLGMSVQSMLEIINLAARMITRRPA